ncbi:MAG: Cytochrome [Frankiales bacterium]|nr:Cytochrome [Frankiales bacterium]
MNPDELLACQPVAVRCPYPYYEELRNSPGITYSEEGGFFLVSRYSEIEDVLRHPEVFSSERPLGPIMARTEAAVRQALADEPELAERSSVVLQRGGILFSADPPVHTRHRRLVGSAFSPKMLAQLEPGIRQVCQDLVPNLQRRANVDLVTEYTARVPILALAMLLGVPPEQSDRFRRWADALNPQHRPAAAAFDRGAVLEMVNRQLEFWQYFQQQVTERQATDRPPSAADLLDRIAHAAADGDTPLTTRETLGLISQFVAAGASTTRGLLSSGAWILSRNPALAGRLRRTPSEIPHFVEEILRAESPVQGMFRTALVDVEISGVAIPAGSALWLMYGSANRDEDVFDHPGEFNIERQNRRAHLAFGGGPHLCLGAGLARLEGIIAFETLLDGIDFFEMVDENSDLDYEPTFLNHIPNRVIVRTSSGPQTSGERRIGERVAQST